MENGEIKTYEDRILNEFDIFIRDNKGYKILKKIEEKRKELNIDKFSKYIKRPTFGFNTNFSNFKEKDEENCIPLYGNQLLTTKNKRNRNEPIGFVSKKQIKGDISKIDGYKVLVAKARGGIAKDKKILSQPILTKENSVCSQTLNEKGEKRIQELLSLIKIHIYNNNILELGSGTGALTNEIIKFNPKSITGIEIDNSLINKAINKKIIILNENIKKIDFKNYKDYLCISAPPYSLIKNIHEDLNRMQFVLIVSPKYFCYFSNFKIIGEIKADMFTPISKKNHFVITNLNPENF